METTSNTTTKRGLPRAMVEDVFMAPVHINAGGVVYTTTLNTLTKYPESKLAKLFDGTLPISIDPVSRQYFIDVNGSVFVHILDFLRYSELLLPDDFTQLPLLIKLARTLGIHEMLKCLTTLRDQQMISSQNDSDEDNRVKFRRNKRNVFPCSIEGNNIAYSIPKKDIGTKDLGEAGYMKDIDGVKSEILKTNEVEAKRLEVDSLKTETIEVGVIKSETLDLEKAEVEIITADNMKIETFETEALKSGVTHMESLQAVNVEMASIDAGAVMTGRLEVGTLMAQALEVRTLNAEALETGTSSGFAKVVLVRYDEYYKIIDVYSPDELVLVNPMCPPHMIRSEYIGNCNRLFYKFNDMPCNNPQTNNKFGVPYLLHFFKQLLSKGYRFSSVAPAGDLNYTRDYVMVRFSSTNTSRP